MASAQQQQPSARGDARDAKDAISLAEFWSRIDPDAERESGRSRPYRGASVRVAG
jgi:hypothetical protein